MLLKDFALRMVANRARLNKAAQIELLGPEHRHFGGFCLFEATMLEEASAAGADFSWETWLIILPCFSRAEHGAALRHE